ncbi:MAG: macro domain-containing protein [Phascolarctobacterium sp.]|nr:macro domain-containing protein [Phascolarctobacterium sp.]
MLYYLEGDIFTSPAQCIVNTVNIVGVMGKGIALAFKEKYPDMFAEYKKACTEGILNIGNLMIWRADDYVLLLFPTKEHWRGKSKIEYIERGLQKFVEIYEREDIKSIAFPKLGCGNGGLDWEEVRPVMEKYLKPLPIDIYIYVDNYNNSNTNPNSVLNMTMEGIKGIINNRIMPLEFSFADKICSIIWEDEIVIREKGNVDFIRLTEEEFFNRWNYLKKMGIFEKSVDKETAVIEELLYSLGFLSKIRIHRNKDVILSGYQVNEGANRRFVVGGDE